MKDTSEQASEAGAEAAEAEIAQAAEAVDPCAELREQLKEALATSESHLDQWRRAAAEFANYRKRVERDNAEFLKTATAGLIKRLLPIVDDLDRAFENMPRQLYGDGWVDGVDLVRQKLAALLKSEGVEPIEGAEASFDPALHEAITYEPSENHEDGDIIDVIQKGYRLGDRVLRPAQVRVAKRS